MVFKKGYKQSEENKRKISELHKMVTNKAKEEMLKIV